MPATKQPIFVAAPATPFATRTEAGPRDLRGGHPADPVTGVVQPMTLFVAALGTSNFIYAEARASEGLADWIGCHVGLFAALGGVPAMIVCDNLKAAVTNPDRYDPGSTAPTRRWPATTARRYVRPGPTSPATRPRWSRRCCWSSAGCWPACSAAGDRR